jgi:hypothetical protein
MAMPPGNGIPQPGRTAAILGGANPSRPSLRQPGPFLSVRYFSRRQQATKDMKRFIITAGVSAALFFLVSFTRIPLTGKLAEIFYGVCGILFSVGMSQVMTFDFSKIADETIYAGMTKSLAIIRNDFVIQFILCTLSFLGFQILDSNSVPPLYLRGRQFSLQVFFNIVIVYSLCFFLYNYWKLSENKMSLDQAIRNESVEDN